MLNAPVDCSKEFKNTDNWYFIAENIEDFDPETASGHIRFVRHARKVRLSFEEVTTPFEHSQSWVFPAEKEEDMLIYFRLEFSENSVNLKLSIEDEPPKVSVKAWDFTEKDGEYVYRGAERSAAVRLKPFRFTLRGGDGRELVGTNNMADSPCLNKDMLFPLAVVRSMETWRCHFAFSLSLAPNEKIFGGGESFTRLDKRGQKMVLYSKDPHGVEFDEMYKPIPFFMSSRGYGVEFKTDAPLTADIGKECNLGNVVYLYDNKADVNFYTGTPKEILRAYTANVGRPERPPLWSFGLWMSRITYKSQSEVLEVAEKFRENKIPCDVINIDVGWFDKIWCCDYKFSKERFPNVKEMTDKLKSMGIRLCLWQYPYITPDNPLRREAVDKGYAVFDSDREVAVRDAVLDFSNPKAVAWYQDKLRLLFRQGVSAIKVDFGEAAPLRGVYASGRSGYYEHNLYPYRYNKAVYEVTKEETGEGVIWARSAWSGSQRYPLHWGGDADNSDNAMLATLRGGLSFGLCGFSFWSHDIGGFVKSSPEELYGRWLAFGMLTSHSRCHGEPPTEPWEYSAEFLDLFRRCVELKYSLMPYIWEQAGECCENGYPMMRTLFFEFPDDPGAWLIEDEYMFGSDLLAAPLFESGEYSRDVYLPHGEWVDYFSGDRYGGGWHKMCAGDIPIILLARAGAKIPHTKPALSTDELDMSNVEYRSF